MARANFDNQKKRVREIAKKDKRAAKDEKRARKKADARIARGPTDGPAAPVSLARPPATNPAAAPIRNRSPPPRSFAG